MESIPGGVRAVGRELLDSGLIKGGESLEQIAPRVAQAREEAGSAIGRLLEGADEAGLQGPKVTEVIDRVRKEVMPRLHTMGETNQGVIDSVERVLNDFRRYGGVQEVGARLPETAAEIAAREAQIATNYDARVGFKQLQSFRSQLDDIIKWNSSPLAPINEKTEAFKAIRGAIESALVDAGEAAAKERGASFAKEYAAAKLRYRRLAVADKAASDALERASANQALSLTDKIAGVGASATALATHGPLGLLAGPVASYGSKLIRERGNSTAAVLFDKASAFGAVERQVRRVDADIDNAVAKFFGKKAEAPQLKAPAGTVAPKEAPAKEFERRVQEVAAAAADKPRASAVVLAKTSPIAEHMPNVRAAIADTSSRAVTYLQAHIPEGRVEQFSATPQLDKPSVSDIQRQQFLDRARTVSNPLSAVADFSKGKASREQIEALRVVYPKIYAQLSQKVDDELASRKAPVPYQKVIQLSSILGRPLSASQDPAFILALGQADKSHPQGNKPPHMASGPPFKTSTMLQTTTQRVEGR